MRVRIDIDDSTTVKAIEFDNKRSARAPWHILFSNGLRGSFKSLQALRYELRNGHAQYPMAEAATKQLDIAQLALHNEEMNELAKRIS